ncbi:MAG: hypothetical protein KTR14_07115 [Vampirovibrio sp.]|nr:hypothetical protein [Vampirovibrio sp.]
MNSEKEGQPLFKYFMIGLLTIGAVFFLVTMASNYSGRNHKTLKADHSIAAVMPTDSFSVPKSDSPLTFKLSNGDIIHLESYPADMGAVVKTGGASSAAGLLLSNLEFVAQQLYDAGEIDADARKRMQALVSQGREIVEIQKFMEDAIVASGGDIKKMAQQKMTVDGITYTAGSDDISDLIGYEEDWASSKQGPFHKELLTGSKTVIFTYLYHQVQKSDSLKHPQIKQFLTDSAAQVLQLTGVSESLYYAYLDKEVAIEDMREYQEAQFNRYNHYYASTVQPPSSALADVKGAAGGIAFKLESGKLIQLNDYPVNIEALVKTKGASSASSVLLANLDSMATQLHDAGEIDTEGFEALKALTEQGQEIADIQKAMETTIVISNDDVTKAQHVTIMVDGKPDKANTDKIGDLIGYEEDWMDEETKPFDAEVLRGTKTVVFAHLFKQAQNKGAMKHPTVKQLVTDITAQILQLTGLSETTYDAYLDEEIAVKDMSLFQANQFSQHNRYYSSGICSGHNAESVSGIRCL